jgi:hypothetical protein
MQQQQQQQRGGVQDWGLLQAQGGWTAALSRELPGWRLWLGLATQQQQLGAGLARLRVLVVLVLLQAAAGCLVVLAAQGPDGGSSR